MHINLKKFVALATAGYLILGTTSCKNKTIKTEEEIARLRGKSVEEILG